MTNRIVHEEWRTLDMIQQYRWSGVNGRKILYQNSTYSPILGYDRVIVRNPDWKVKVAKRVDASSAYFSQGISSLQPVIASGRDVSYGQGDGGKDLFSELTLRTYLPSTGFFAEKSSSSAKDLALASLKRKLSNRVGDMQLMAPLAELREVRGLVKQTALMTSSMLQTLIDIKRTKGKSAAKYASQAWLAFGFGISPLLADTRNLCNSISSYLLRTDITERLTGTASTDFVTYANSNALGTFSSNLRTNARFDWKVSYRYTAAFSVPLKSATNYGVSDHFNISFGALVPTFWELVPYSWALDYFTTVGAYLDDTFTSDASKCLYCVESKKTTASCTIRGVIQANNPTVTKVLQSSVKPGLVRYWHFRRTPLAILPTRTLRFKSIDEIGLHGINKVLNLAAVLLQRKL